MKYLKLLFVISISLFFIASCDAFKTSTEDNSEENTSMMEDSEDMDSENTDPNDTDAGNADSNDMDSENTDSENTDAEDTKQDVKNAKTDIPNDSEPVAVYSCKGDTTYVLYRPRKVNSEYLCILDNLATKNAYDIYARNTSNYCDKRLKELECKLETASDK